MVTGAVLLSMGKRDDVKSVLRLPDLEYAKAVLNRLTSSDAQRGIVMRLTNLLSGIVPDRDRVGTWPQHASYQPAMNG